MRPGQWPYHEAKHCECCSHALAARQERRGAGGSGMKAGEWAGKGREGGTRDGEGERTSPFDTPLSNQLLPTLPNYPASRRGWGGSLGDCAGCWESSSSALPPSEGAVRRTCRQCGVPAVERWGLERELGLRAFVEGIWTQSRSSERGEKQTRQNNENTKGNANYVLEWRPQEEKRKCIIFTCAPTPAAGPFGPRKTIGHLISPADM